MPASRKTVVDLLRHGEPVGGSKYRGQTDDPLSEKGWGEMRAAVAGHHHWDVIISSSLSRCRAFARELSDQHSIALEIEPRLVEIGFGSWEGRTAADLEHENPGQVFRFLNDPLQHTPAGAEPLIAFRSRVQAAWEEVLARHTGRKVLIVGHAGIVRMVLTLALDIPIERLFRIQVPSAGLSRIEVEQRDGLSFPRLIFHAGAL